MQPEVRPRIFLLSLCAFLLLQVTMRSDMVENSFILSLLIVTMAGVFFGWRPGLAAGFVLIAANVMFFFGRGGRDFLDYLRHSAAAWFLVMPAAGFAVGRARELWDARKHELALRRQIETSLRESQQRYRDLLATTERQARTLALLEQVQNALARELDRDSIYRVVVEITAEIFAYNLVSIYTVEEDHFQLVHEVGYDRLHQRIPIDQGVIGRCLRARRGILVRDVTTDPDYIHGGDGVCSEVCVPIFEAHRIAAVFNIESDCTRELNDDDLHLMLHLAEYIKVALERARLFANIQDHARQMALLNEITSTAVRASSPADRMFFQTLADRLANLIESDAAYLTLWDDVRRVPIAAAAFGQMRDTFTSVVFPQGEITATETVLTTGRPLVIEDYPSSPYVSPVVRSMFTIRSALVLPLIASQQKLGAVLFAYSRPHIFTPGEIALAEQAAGQVALVLTKLLLIQRIEQMAITDELTGLYNRHGLADMGRREFERALRYNRPLAAMLMDIDHFKQVNDTCGHAAGDEVLRQLARVCRETLRETDLVIRYGGEEILVLMPENQLPAALDTAERLRAALAALRVELCGQVVTITVSIGVAELNENHASLDGLIACADRALYNAKQTGRDRVATC